MVPLPSPDNSSADLWQDLNLPQEEFDTVNAVIDSGDVEKEVAVQQALLEENSPYPEVQAAVRNYDEPDLPANTIRAWVIGIILTTVCSSINLLFSLRNPSIIVTTYCVQLVAYPVGLAWDMVGVHLVVFWQPR